MTQKDMQQWLTWWRKEARAVDLLNKKLSTMRSTTAYWDAIHHAMWALKDVRDSSEKMIIRNGGLLLLVGA